MARQVRRISELPEATALKGDELLEIVQDGGNKRVTVGQLSGGGAVQSVQGRTGAVVITADDVGLGNVDNTSDAAKSIGGNAATATLAADSSKLGGQLPEYYATAAQIGDIATALDLINGEVI